MTTGTPDWGGQPSVDRLAALWGPDTRLVTAGSPINYLPYPDTSIYHSVLMIVNDVPVAPYTGTDARLWDTYWLDGSGTINTEKRKYMVPNANGYMSARVRKRGNKFNLSAGSLPRDSNVTTTIVGSYEQITDDEIYLTNGMTFASPLNQAALNTDLRLFAYNGLAAAIGNYYAAPNFQVGDYTVYYAATNAATLFIWEASTSNEIYSWNMAAGSRNVFPGKIHLGPVPYVIVLNTTAINTSYWLSFVRCGNG